MLAAINFDVRARVMRVRKRRDKRAAGASLLSASASSTLVRAPIKYYAGEITVSAIILMAPGEAWPAPIGMAFIES